VSTRRANKHFHTAKQRPLVFQGGGAIAAYEVGVCAVIYFWIKKDLKKIAKMRIFLT
jgi:hypothetical protein